MSREDGSSPAVAGDLFEGDYPDSRTDEERERDRTVVLRQVRTLGTPVEPLVVDFPQLLQKRRGRADSGVVQFEIVPSQQGQDTFVAAGEILVRPQRKDGAGADTVADGESALERNGFARQPGFDDCPELRGSVARFVRSGIDARELLEVVSQLRAEGQAASLNHITPLAKIIKGLGGSEPSAATRTLVRTRTASAPTRVAVIDTGVAAEMRTDGWLSHADIERRGDNIDELDMFPAGGDRLLDFASGHGTFVTAVIQQVWPDADIRVYRAVDSDGVGTEFGVACAMIRAVREGAQILNLSVGSQTVDDGPPVALEAALDVIETMDPEVLVVAAAGNNGDTRPCWPAAFRRVVAVAGLRNDLTPASTWSSHGVWVDCSTIGEGITSPYVQGWESNLIDPDDPDHFGPNSWAVWTGTSFAAPQITGALARICQERGHTPRQALGWLLAQGVAVPNFGRAVRILPGT